MDDCNLEKLAVKPGTLSPGFHKDTTEYTVTLGSNVEKITFDLLTSDTGASYCISGGEGSKTVPLKEGQINSVKIEVSAEDGTTKKYMVHVHRLSAKDATLGDLKVPGGQLEPEFSPEMLEYYVSLQCGTSSLAVIPTVPDTKAAVTVNGCKPGAPLNLSLGATKVELQVTSPDGSNKQSYTIIIVRKQFPQYARFTDPQLDMKYECPVSLAAIYQPITIKGSDPPHSFSLPIIDDFTRTNKIDPLSEMPLDKDWRIEDYNLDALMSEATVYIPLADGSKSETMKLREIGAHLKDYHKMPHLGEISTKYDTNVAVAHTMQTRGWEKQMQQIFDENNPMKLCNQADEALQNYYTSLPKSGRKQQYETGSSPMDFLQQAIHCYATAIKNKSQDSNLHLQLGLVLEERYYAEDMIGLKKDGDGGDIPSFNLQAKESSKEEECAAICKLRGVEAGSPIALQLKAIDQEFHHLVESGQSGKSDHVQGLFMWKSKQASQEGAAAQKVADDNSPLGQAYLKYLDALSLDESKAVYQFHVGRMLVVQGNYDDAVQRLEACLGWNAQHQQAKFYLGLALSLKKGGAGSRSKEAIIYLFDGMDALFQKNTEEALSTKTSRESGRNPSLHANDLVRNSNVHLLRGLIQLGKLLASNTDLKEVMTAQDVFHNAALLASQVLPNLSRGDTYQQVEWVLLDAHSQLLETLLATQKDNVALIAQRCERLSALIKQATIPHNTDLLGLQLKTSQMLVQIQPCSSHALYLLGNSQLTQYDNDPTATQLLDDCKRSFRASIGLEGKPASGELSPELKDQQWWQDKVKREEENKAAAVKPAGSSKPAAGPAKGGAAAGKGVVPAGRGGAAARGGATGRGAAATRGGATAAARGGRGGGPVGRGAATSTRGGKAAPVPAKGSGATKPATSKPATSTGPAQKSASQHSCDGRPASAAKKTPIKAEEKKEEVRPTENVGSSPPIPLHINKKSHHARLGLARALAKGEEDLTESAKYYHEVIDIAPEVHDAYIESAEMLAQKEPLAAVDIYCRFPISENPSFDDAYILGEIVRLLMKAEKFDDPRLGPNMITMGKVMGIASMEKYIQILDDKFKTELLKKVYAGVNGRNVDDPEMQAFYKHKCWV